ncbi:ATP-binding protein [Pseudonocardia benzenivorans]
MVSKFAVGGGDEFARRTWPAEVGRLRLLRNEVRCWLEALGYGLAMVDDLVLAVNEAATNAMEHAYVPPRPDSTVDVEFWIDGDALRIVVRDHGQWQPPGPQRAGHGYSDDEPACRHCHDQPQRVGHGGTPPANVA